MDLPSRTYRPFVRWGLVACLISLSGGALVGCPELGEMEREAEESEEFEEDEDDEAFEREEGEREESEDDE